MYMASAILLNMATCLYKCRQVGHYFKVEAPSLNDYMRSNWLAISSPQSWYAAPREFLSFLPAPHDCVLLYPAFLARISTPPAPKTFDEFLQTLESLRLPLLPFRLSGKHFSFSSIFFANSTFCRSNDFTIQLDISSKTFLDSFRACFIEVPSWLAVPSSLTCSVLLWPSASCLITAPAAVSYCSLAIWVLRSARNFLNLFVPLVDQVVY